MELRRLLRARNLYLFLLLALSANSLLFILAENRRVRDILPGTSVGARGYYREEDRLLAGFDAVRDPEGAAEKSREYEAALGGYRTGSLTETVILRSLHPYLEYVTGYPAYLDGIQRSAVELSSVALFSKPGTFSARNLEKTAADYQKLQAVTLTPGSYRAAEAVLEDRMTGVWILAAMVFLAFLLLEDRRKNLRKVIYSTSGGRGKLALKRCILFFVLGACVSLLFQAGTIVSSVILYGMPDLSVPAQSVSELGALPMPLSLGAFFLYYVLFMTAGMLVIGFLILCLMAAFEEPAVGLTLFGIIMAAEYALFVLLPEQSVLNLFKYGNLFSFIYPGRLMCRYLNANVGGYPVNLRELMTWLEIPLTVAGFLAACLLLGAKQKENRNRLVIWLREGVLRLRDVVLRGAAGFSAELYKEWVLNKQVITLAAFAWLCLQFYPWHAAPASLDVLDHRLAKWQGPVSEHTVEEILAEKSGAEEEIRKAGEAREAYERGEIPEADAVRFSHQEEAAARRLSALTELEGRIGRGLQRQQEEGIPAWLVSEKALLRMTEEERSADALWLAGLLTVILSGSGLYAGERERRVRQALYTAPRGRGRLVSRKQAVLLLTVALTVGAGCGLEWHYYSQVYGAPLYAAPVQTVSELAAFPWHISVGGYLWLRLMFRTICLWMAAQGAGMLSSFIGRRSAAAAASMLLFAVPAALDTMGAGIVEPVSLVRLLAAGQYGELFSWGVHGTVATYTVVLALGCMAAAAGGFRWCRADRQRRR